MSRLLHRSRRFLTATFLGLWVFALFAGIADACSRDGATAVQHQPAMTAHAIADADYDSAPGCDDFCSNDVPLLSVSCNRPGNLSQGSRCWSRHATTSALSPLPPPAIHLAWTACPSLGVPLSLRFVRLTL